MSSLEKILCVDDEAQICAALKIILGGEYEVVTTVSASDALAMIATDGPFAVVISDMQMPGMDGTSLLKKMHELSNDTVRILLTGMTDAESAIQAVNQGHVYKYLTKPCPPSELRIAVREAVSHYRELMRAKERLTTEIQRRKESETRVRKLEDEDALTGLYAPRRFCEILKGALQSPCPGSTPIGVFFILLPRFYGFHTMHGQSVSIHVIQEIAHRIAAFSKDTIAVCRWSSYEIVLMKWVASAGDTTLAAEARLLSSALGRPILIDGRPLPVRIAVGARAVRATDQDPSEIVQHAEIAAADVSLSDSSSTSGIFSEELLNRTLRKNEFTLALKAALTTHALEVHYQPIVDISKSHVHAVEALMRWNHPKFGTIPPSLFVPLAEQIGESITLGEYVLEMACRQMAPHLGETIPRLAVNLSVHQLLSSGFIQRLDEILASVQFSPNRLEVEITESMFAHDFEAMARVVSQLHQRNIKVSMDDFGTGYSSLAYLHRIHVDVLKIDRSFVLDFNGHGKTIIAAILSIARSFGLEVVVEGLETEELSQAVSRMGAHVQQGFLIAEPMPAEKLMAWHDQFLTARTPPSLIEPSPVSSLI